MAKLGNTAGWFFNKHKRATTAGLRPQAGTNAPPMTGINAGPYVYYDMQGHFQHQKHINMCGEACVAMLYSYQGDDAQIDMRVNPRGTFEGSDDDDLLAAYPRLRRGRGLDTAGFTADDLDGELRSRGGPLMVAGEFARFLGHRWGHWIVVQGIVGNRVYIADPWHGEDRQKTFDWFIGKATNPMHFIYYV